MDIVKESAVSIAEKIRTGEVSAVSVAEAFLAQIDAVENEVSAFITVEKEKVLDEARVVDEKLARGEQLAPLAGVPIAVKDNVLIKGGRMTAASKMLENFISPYDSKVAEDLRVGDIPVIGKTNLDEFAMGGTCEKSFFGATKNPVDLNHVPGGSSGGSAAAVAALEAPFAIGTDTGGSVRQPAAYCGVVGFKPTYSAISRYGVTAFASSFDHVGLVARTASDVEALFGALANHDPRDVFSVREFLVKSLSLKGLRVAIPKELFELSCDKIVKETVLAAANVLAENGAILTEVSLPNIHKSSAVYTVLTAAEASSNLGRFDGVRYGHRTENYETIDELYQNSRGEGFGAEVKKRILLGAQVLSEDSIDVVYHNARRARSEIVAEIEALFEEYDIILSPTTGMVAPKLGALNENFYTDVQTIPANLAGIPAISIPCGRDENGLPIGLQLMARRCRDFDVLQIAQEYEALRAENLHLPVAGLEVK